MAESAFGPLTDADLLAPVLLNVSQLRVATYYRLQDEVPRWQALLTKLDPSLGLVGATEEDRRLVGALFEGIDAGRLAGARATTLSKILHRKRPALIPLQDVRIRRCYQQGADAPLSIVPGRSWEAFTIALCEQIQHDLRDQQEEFEHLANLASALPVTPLRAFDIIAWHLGQPQTTRPGASAS